MKKQKWIGFKKPKFIGIDFDCKGNPLIDWQETLKLKMDRDTIGYDFKDPYISFKGLEFAVRLSTDNNIYCPNPKEIIINKITNDEVVLSSKSLSAAGGQIISEGFIVLQGIYESL